MKVTDVPDTVTVCITSCGRLDLLDRTLESFKQFNRGARFIVHEDSTDLDVIDRVRQSYPDAIILSGPTRIGIMASIDRLYSLVETPYIFHCEDDWEFDGPIAWEAAIEALCVSPDIANVSVRAFSEIGPKYQERSTVAQIAGETFRVMNLDAHPEYFSWHPNPGLIKTELHRKYAPFARVMPDQMSGLMKKDGLRLAYLMPGVAHHIGQGRNVVDPTMPARPKGRPAKWLRAIKKKLYYAGWRSEPF